MEGEMVRSVECAETPLFSIKGFELPFLFIYSPTLIKGTTCWIEQMREKAQGQ